MENSNSMNDIQKLVQEIATYCNRYTSADSIPTIEVDILKQKTRELYDILSRIDSQVSIQPKAEIAEPSEKTQITEPQPVETQQNNPVQQEETTTVDFEITEIEKVEETPKEEVSQEQPTIEPQPKETVVEQITDTFFTKEPTDFGSKQANSKIEELSPTTFCLNERVHYRTALFNNNQELFIKTLENLNDCKTFENALKYIQTNFDWDFENNDVKKFLTFVKRRFL